MIDWKKESVSTNPENAFLLKQYTGADKDTTLGELAEFLRGTFFYSEKHETVTGLKINVRN